MEILQKSYLINESFYEGKGGAEGVAFPNLHHFYL